MDSGHVQLMEIAAYTDNTFQNAAGDKFLVQVNPDKYTLDYATMYNQKSGTGSSESIPGFNKRKPQILTFKFIFDSSGAVPNTTAGDIMADFGSFKKVVYSYNGDVHQPRFVQLRWGVLIYNCRLTDMKVNFTLFKSDGTPIRAMVDCTFQGYIDEKKLAAKENKSSPDLTHIISVGAGDTLPLLCNKVYKDSRHYFEIARYMAANYNYQIDFKKLAPGTKLYLPPLRTNK